VLHFKHESFQSFTCTATDKQEIKQRKMQNNGTQSELVKNTHTQNAHTHKIHRKENWNNTEDRQSLVYLLAYKVASVI